jgi:hypothetical protein
MKNEIIQTEKVAQPPIVAICYDFDKTLSPKDMQEYSLIPMFGKTAQEFWTESNGFAKSNGMDQIISYMKLILKCAKECSDKMALRKGDFVNMGKTVELFKGVEGWFDRINAYAAGQGLAVEHYVISAGLGEIIEGTSIYKHFKKVFASCFFYDANNVPIIPRQIVNYTQKTQYMFRINKGCLDLSDDAGVNRNIPDDLRRIPFRNFIYIGDSDTDIPAMRLVKKENGHSIGVYNPAERGAAQVCQLVADGRINFFAPADYSDGAPLDRYVKMVINKIKVQEDVARVGSKQVALVKEFDRFKSFVEYMKEIHGKDTDGKETVSRLFTINNRIFKKNVLDEYRGECFVPADITKMIDNYKTEILGRTPQEFKAPKTKENSKR